MRKVFRFFINPSEKEQSRCVPFNWEKKLICSALWERGFLGTSNTFPVLVAGGYGSAALYLQAATLPIKGVAFLGGQSAKDILCIDEFEALGWNVRVATDDGSLGIRGFVTVALDRWLKEQREVDQRLEFYSCGPNAMLKAVGDRALKNGFTAWLSMDRNMVCGVGACLACVIKQKTKTGWEWARCCKEGPVFNAKDIL